MHTVSFISYTGLSLSVQPCYRKMQIDSYECKIPVSMTFSRENLVVNNESNGVLQSWNYQSPS